MKSEEGVVPLLTASALKELGFDLPCSAYYKCNGYIMYFKGNQPPRNYNDGEELKQCGCSSRYSAPTLEQAAKWLRDSCGWAVVVEPEYDKTWFYHIVPIGGATHDGGEGYKTYEDALASGIASVISAIMPRSGLAF